jgi:hypothetical protein
MKKLFKNKILLLLFSVAIISLFFFPDSVFSSDPGGFAMAVGFAPLFDICGIENMGGFQNRLAFIPQCDVSDMPALPANPATDADLVTATGAFIFKSENGKPMYIYATKGTVSYSADNQGETDGQSFHITGQFFFPGTLTQAAAFARKVNNTPGYLILISMEGEQILVGQKGLPCSIKPAFSFGQAPADRRGFTFSYEADSYAAMVKLGTPIDFDALGDPNEDPE